MLATFSRLFKELAELYLASDGYMRGYLAMMYEDLVLSSPGFENFVDVVKTYCANYLNRL